MTTIPSPRLRKISAWFGSNQGVVIASAALGGAGALLSAYSGARNTGFCITGFFGDLLLVIFPSQYANSCFCSIQRDVGIQALNRVDYIRPEYIGLMLGSFLSAVIFREYQVKGGSSPLVRFLLGFLGMLGILAFWGCPVRTMLRLGGGDMSALVGVAGLAAGVGVGILFFHAGFELRRSRPIYPPAGLLLPTLLVASLIWIIVAGNKVPLPRASLPLALGAGLAVGFLAQRSRLCIMSSFRNAMLMKNLNPLLTVATVVVSASIINLLMGTYHLGFSGQPLAHTDLVWGFLGALTGGICFTLAGACPTRQLILIAEGNFDSAVFVLGMLAAAWTTQLTGYLVMPDMVVLDTVLVGGPNLVGKASVIMGLFICILVGFSGIKSFRRAYDLSR